MIVKGLATYYDALLRDGVEGVSRPGWFSRPVGYAIELAEDGALRNVIPADSKRGWLMSVPEQPKRSSGVASFFLCDTSTYLLGIDSKGKPERAAKCFEAARALHHDVLDGCDSPVAKAVLRHFDTWDPANAEMCPPLVREWEGLCSGKFIVFTVNCSEGRVEPVQDQQIMSAWDHYVSNHYGDMDSMVCLVSGERSPIARLHPSIKGVYGAQSMGATLIGFNCPSFESYGHDGEQGLNAPVSSRIANAYSAALNYLLQSDLHHCRLGDTTVVYWSEHEDAGNCNLFNQLLFGSADSTNQKELEVNLDGVMRAVASGKYVALDDIDLSSSFFILGLAPNAARLSVRFFHKGNFGDILSNICMHYDQLELAHAPGERKYLSPYMLLKDVENPNAKKPVISSVLGGSLMRSILTGAPYPTALYENALLRIRTTNENQEARSRKVTYNRASIIKAYLLRNCRVDKEEISVELNEKRRSTAYSLGRAFSIMECAQEQANGVSRLAARYLDSACSTPATVFPVLFKLCSAHFEKLGRDKPGMAVWLRRQLLEIVGEENMVPELPKHLDLQEQGDFFLGYYQQTQARYKAKTQADTADSNLED